MPTETIYTSDLPAPQLPRTSFFDYILPGAGSASPLARYDPSLPAYVDGLTGRTATRGAVHDGALRLAGGLRRLGVRRGDAACVWGPNSIEWAQAAFGLLAAGVVLTPANAAYEPHEIAHQINDSSASILFVDPALLPKLEAARKLFKRDFDASRIILLSQTEAKPKGTKFKSIYEAYGAPIAAERFDGDDAHSVAVMCYSSGTTGLPKGVETTHYNLTSQFQGLPGTYTPLVSGQDSLLGILPLSHVYGFVFILFQPFSVGVPAVLLPRFAELEVLQAIERFKITYTLLVPPIIIVLLNSTNVDKYDLSSLTKLTCAAAPLSAELGLAFERKFPNIKMPEGYGMTEASPAITTSSPESHVRGSVGKLLPVWEARLVNDGVDAPPGERGELWVRGPCVMKRYHNNPAATTSSITPDGWFKTGDVLTRSEDGWYRVVDRVKELIKYKGFQVPPAELEGLLLEHPKVADSGVVGVHDESQATELPPAEHASLVSEVAEWVAQRVAGHKKLRGGVVVVDVIPKSPSGKILRKDLRKRAEEEWKASGVQAKAKL
ncbi:hypothetical protein VHUM_03990 [Vanrija humicola]|uniref:AMP-dependent synthetase/ligase domain-containing protein n=1 Tax=Vanrija humicola TaxID=5417 RepID=A0A7D8ZGX6_VANHU|nr:hypothetical protein VHUM_03990 [Vanrija humicola]